MIRKDQARASQSDRAHRLARVTNLATETIGNEARATSWLRTQSPYLGGETPVRMLETEIGTELVVASLYAIAYGGVA
jgi:putative toxin-antitoxin system antitoxin component (TIGR02293 family)